MHFQKWLRRLRCHYSSPDCGKDALSNSVQVFSNTCTDFTISLFPNWISSRPRQSWAGLSCFEQRRFLMDWPLTFRFAEHLALAAAYATSPVMDTLQLYRISVCLPPSSMMSTSCHVISWTVVKDTEELVSHNVILTKTQMRGAHRGRAEDFAVQLPLAVDVVLGNLHLETSRLSIKQLNAINRPNYLDVTSCWERKTKPLRTLNFKGPNLLNQL